MSLLNRVRILRYLFQDVGRGVAPAEFRPEPLKWGDEQVTASLLGHATVLINFCGLTILTDPVFSERAGIRVWPFTIGPKRFVQPALRARDLPPIDLVLLSHAHMDHLDKRSLRSLPKRKSAVVMACGTSDLVRGMRFREVHELGWDETITVAGREGDVTITAMGLRHWGARFPWDKGRSYNAYILERAGRRICFAGDTARTDAHKLGRRGPIDLMLMPISAYHPWITNHCTPEEGIAMADEAGAKYVLPIHFETFKLSWEPLDEPIRRFQAAIDPARVALSKIGQTFVLPP